MGGPRVAVLGSGANGTSVGVDLARAGVDVTLVEQWPDHVEAMRAGGARVRLDDEEWVEQVPVLHLCQVAELREPFDVVLMLMKAYDSRWAAELVSSVLADDGLLVGVQNGMTADVVADVVGEHRTVGCVIECSAAMHEPGVVRRYTPPASSWFAVGSLGPAAAGREDEVAELLRHSGTVAHFDDIRSAKWMKLVSNCSVLVPTAALGLPMADAIEVPGFRDLMVAAGQEALAVGTARGHATLPIFGLDASDVARPDTLVEVMLDRLYAGFVKPGATTTVLHDWEKGRRSEAGDLNGLVSALGRELGVPTPVNDAVFALAREIETGRAAPGTGHAERLLGVLR
ncbi:MAG: 2-dehydropantoate 2-reductase N-terminal domain-containing protein [Nocardioidaceae bacterium]